MAYTATSWVNGSEPAINAANLNKLEAGVVAAHDAAAVPTAWEDVSGKPSTFPPDCGHICVYREGGGLGACDFRGYWP